MRKIFIEELPKQIRGKNKRIDWEKSVGYTVGFIYDDVIGNIKIIGYDKFDKNVRYIYNEDIFTLYRGDFSRCMIGKALWKSNNKKCNENKDKRIKKSVYDTHNYLVPYFLNESDSKIYSHGSSKKVEMLCPYCGYIREHNIASLVRNGFACHKCGDGISKPNKIMFNVLTQLEEEFVAEYSPDWAVDEEGSQRRYDFYIPSKNLIIEMDGGFHYDTGRKFGIDSTYIKLVDDWKDLQAQNHDILLIRVNCKKNDVNSIFKSINNSKISTIYNLSNVNFEECVRYSMSNIAKKCCELWEDGFSINEISDIFSISTATVQHHLSENSGRWCSYDAAKEQFKGRGRAGKKSSKAVEVFKDGNYIGVFSGISELSRVSESVLGVRLSQSGISSVLTRIRKSHKGYKFEYVL